MSHQQYPEQGRRLGTSCTTEEYTNRLFYVEKFNLDRHEVHKTECPRFEDGLPSEIVLDHSGVDDLAMNL